MRLLKEKCTLSYYKYPFPIFQNFPIISTPQSQKTRALTIIRGVLIIGNKEYQIEVSTLSQNDGEETINVTFYLIENQVAADFDMPT